MPFSLIKIAVLKPCYECFVTNTLNRYLVSLVGKVPVYRVGGWGSIPGQTNNQDLKTIEEKVLSLL